MEKEKFIKQELAEKLAINFSNVKLQQRFSNLLDRDNLENKYFQDFLDAYKIFSKIQISPDNESYISALAGNETEE